MRKLTTTFLAALVAIVAGNGCAQDPGAKPEPESKSKPEPTETMTTTKTEAGATNEVAVIETKFGKIVVELFEEDAPKTVANFKKLAREGFYDGTTFHRVIPNFMIQGGDPNSKDDDRTNDGMGGPGYTVEAEIKHDHNRGTLATARQGDQVNPQRRSSGSQFFINVKDNDFLNKQYTVFGKVISGMDVADKIVAVERDRRDNPLDKVEMKVSITSKEEALKK
jgi:cyclophilin family peptidyl-prolyl cis-trans isomerase